MRENDATWKILVRQQDRKWDKGRVMGSGRGRGKEMVEHGNLKEGPRSGVKTCIPLQL